MKAGDTVIYVPRHIQEDNMNKFNFKNPLCEYGTIKSANERFIFVNYVQDGIPQNTAQATDPRDLFFLNGDSIINVFEIFDTLDI
jgi:hypothetical protein